MTNGKTVPTRFAICGFAEGSLHDAPFGDPDWHVWGVNRLHTIHEGPYTAYFNLHDLEKYHGEDKEHLAFLKNFGGPVFLRPQDMGKFDIPNAQPFPYQELINHFGTRYFNNTISWLIGFAIMHEGITDLGLFGVDMAMDSLVNAEYGHQKPSCEYFLGIAAGMGVKLHIPHGSDLLKTSHLYGFEDDTEQVQKGLARLNELGQRKEKAKAQLAQLDGQRQQLINAINQMDGAMQDVQFWIRNWTSLRPGEPVVSESLPPNADPQQGNGQVTVQALGGGWYELPNGEKLQGKAAVELRVKELIDASPSHID